MSYLSISFYLYINFEKFFLLIQNTNKLRSGFNCNTLNLQIGECHIHYSYYDDCIPNAEMK